MTKLKTVLVAALALFVFTNITKAANVTPGQQTTVEADPIKVKYLGAEGNFLLFQVVLQYSTPTNARLAIEDKKAGEIYSTGYRSDLKSSTIRIEKTDADQVLAFKLFLGKKTYSKSFSINTNLVETTTVSERDVTNL